MNILNFFSGKKTDDKGGSGKDPNNNIQNNNSSKSSSLNLKFNSTITGELDSLNNLIKLFKFNNMVFKNYEEYLTILNFLMSKNNKTKTKLYQNELDYLYKSKLKSLKKEPKANESNINKMKEIGKIFISEQTSLEDKSNQIGQNGCILLTSNLKVESLNSFFIIMANNCITNGKWVYEVTLLSNGLMQIGFCQLITQFTRHMEVGG